MIDSLSISAKREDSQLSDASAREQAEQEELCDVLSRFYDIIRPEEEEVRMKEFFSVVLNTKHGIKWFNIYIYIFFLTWQCDTLIELYIAGATSL